MGYHFVDQSSHDVPQVAATIGESTFHCEAKLQLWLRLRSPKLSTATALVILGDLEFQIGNSALGRRFVGIASQIALDTSIILSDHTSGGSNQEMWMRRHVVAACSLYDNNWALLGGLSPLVRTLEMGHREWVARSKEKHTPILPNSVSGLEEQIYVAAAELQNFCETIIEMRHSIDTLRNGLSLMGRGDSERVSLNRDMTAWYQGLSPELRWTSNKKDVVPVAFFLLHQQYNAAMIRLHQSFSCHRSHKTGPVAVAPSGTAHLGHLTAISQTVCSRHAKQIVHMLDAQESRFGHAVALLPGLQAAATAAGALMDAIAQTTEPAQREPSSRSLKVLLRILSASAGTCKPAGALADMILNFLNRSIVPSDNRA
ncbi:hypothetical protein LTR13_004881 [Exophiala sideris]|nr:hypothetical protein LTR13_004881 [Exophiala sideris]KAK5182234.1 hypothetical protein LTR44_005245 [Eurotiomycetes sp. CCFEE 6388]